MSEPDRIARDQQIYNEEMERIRENARRQAQFDYFDDDQWRLVASGTNKPIETGLRLLYRLVRAVEDVAEVLNEQRPR